VRAHIEFVERKYRARVVKSDCVGHILLEALVVQNLGRADLLPCQKAIRWAFAHVATKLDLCVYAEGLPYNYF
jgi:hypothetical protein